MKRKQQTEDKGSNDSCIPKENDLQKTACTRWRPYIMWTYRGRGHRLKLRREWCSQLSPFDRRDGREMESRRQLWAAGDVSASHNVRCHS